MQLTPDKIFAGRYRLLSKIGIGGFSEVWKVADEMAEDKVMVLKIYAPERGLDEFGIKQFRREYAITLDLNHPNLLKANHFDVFDGSPYLIMPFCEGGSLYSKLMEHGPMSEKEVTEMLLQVVEALEYLHQNDIVHQDIKPDNVLIDKRGRYLLTDFGISSRLKNTLQKSTTTSKAMTVAYAPPEKFHGLGTVGPAGDIFSLGVMAVELLTGELPWGGMGGAYLRKDSEPLKLPSPFSGKLASLVEECLLYDQSLRPNSKTLQDRLKSKFEPNITIDNTEKTKKTVRETAVIATPEVALVDSPDNLDKSANKSLSKNKLPFSAHWEYSEGLASVFHNGKYGYVDEEGYEVIPFIYEQANKFQNGLAKVKLGNQWNLIDKEGKNKDFNLHESTTNSIKQETYAFLVLIATVTISFIIILVISSRF